MTDNRFFECSNCGQTVQGWHAANEWINCCDHKNMIEVAEGAGREDQPMQAPFLQLQWLLSSSVRRTILEKAGLANPQVIARSRDHYGFPSLLLEAVDDSDWPFRGWLREGMSVADIQWDTKQITGWPEELSFPID